MKDVNTLVCTNRIKKKDMRNQQQVTAERLNCGAT